MADWIFDRVPPSGAVQGGSALLHTLGTGLGIDTFVREVIQNSYDQTDPGNHCEVHFELHRLDGEDKKSLFRAIRFGSLKTHLRGLSQSTIEPSLMNTRLRQGLDTLTRGPVTILRIDDSGTKGLSGSEDDHLGNFNALCRNQLVTSEDKPARGGSYGLGKAVLWGFSSISTVMFSSRIHTDGVENGFRLFGRAELAHHETKSGQWSGQGWFGGRQRTGTGERAVSLWGDTAESIARRASLFRPAQLGNGTTILILGFQEPDQEHNRSVEEISADIARSTVKWFWPGIHYMERRLNVTVKAYDHGTQVYSATADSLREIAPFISVMENTSDGSAARDPGDVGTSPIGLNIPGRKLAPSDPETQSRLILKLRRSTEEDSMDLANRVALVRGNSGMVLAYKHLRPPIDGTPFHAVLLAGEAAGSLETDHRLDRFLRACEPPSHNDWLPGTERLRAEYHRGASARIQGLWKDLDAAASNLCEETPASLTAGPRRLAEMFPLRSSPGKTQAIQRFKTDGLEASFTGGRWLFKGRVTKVIHDQRDWGFSLSFTLDVETGNGTTIDIGDIQVSSGTVEIEGSRCVCRVRSEIREIEFEGSAQPHPEGEGLTYMARTRARLDVRPHHMVPGK